MQFKFEQIQLVVNAQDAAMAARLTLGGAAGWAITDGELIYELPGVDALDEEQQTILEIFAEYKVAGIERYRGIIEELMKGDGLEAAKRRLMVKAIINGGKGGDPTGALVLMVAKIANESLNRDTLRKPVKFENLLASAISNLAPGN